MDSVKFDSTELVSSTYNVSKVLDNTTPSRSLNLIESEGVDGAVIVNDRFGTKIIDIKGILIGSSASDLQDKIDTLNELFSRKDKNLDIKPNGGSTRRYVVRLTGAVEYDRDYYNVDYVPFRASFMVAEGVGKDTSSTSALSHLASALERDPTPTGSNTVSLLGSAEPKPSLSFTLTTIGKLDLITITNDDTGEEMSIEVDQNFSNGDEVVVNVAEQTVNLNGVPISFLGKIPTFSKGDNDLHITYQGATLVLDQEQSTDYGTGFAVGNPSGTKYCQTQSFIAGQSGYLSQIKIYGAKVGTPGNLQVRVFSDNGELPYENLVAGETGWSEPHASFGVGGAEITLTDSSPGYYLRKGVKYWLVFQTTDSSGNYYVLYGSNATDHYPDGKLLRYDGAVTPPADPNDWVDQGASSADMYFKTYQGQGGAVDWLLDFVVSYIKRYL